MRRNSTVASCRRCALGFIILCHVGFLAEMCLNEIVDQHPPKGNALAPGHHGSASEIARDSSSGDISDPYKVQLASSDLSCVGLLM